jgi:hypothetical protein
MKRTIVFLVALVFTFTFFPPVEATIFKKGDKIIDKRTGDVYEFQYKADIGIYSADSGLGDLFIINGKVYAITPQGVMGMKAVSKRTDMQAELKAAIKRYKNKKAETARAWKTLAAEKRKSKLLGKAIKNYKKAATYYEFAVQEFEEERAALKEKIVELEQWGDVASGALTESRDSLITIRRFLEVQEKKHRLFGVSIIVLFCMLPVMFGAGICYRTFTLRKAVEPAEEMEITDLTDLV